MQAEPFVFAEEVYHLQCTMCGSCGQSSDQEKQKFEELLDTERYLHI